MTLSIKSVTKTYNGVKAVDNVSFEVKPGQIIGLLGPNGAGKTTTMSIITGILAPDEGEVLFDDKTLQSDEMDIKSRIGFLSETNPLYHEMLVHEYLDFMAALRNIPKEERKKAIETVMEETGITDRKFQPIEELSKGYRQRVGLAQAILHHPEILILDEPTEGLDPNQRVTIRDLIAKLGKDRTVLISTHVLSEVQAMCDHVVILNKGKLVSQGSVEEIIQQGQKIQQVSLEVKGDGVIDAIKSQSNMKVLDSHQNDGNTVVSISSDADADIRPKLFELVKSKGWTLYDLHRTSANLEDIFRNLTLGEINSKVESHREETKQEESKKIENSNE